MLLQDETLRRGCSKKLEAPWTRPYRVTEKLSDVNDKIQVKQKTICVHANRNSSSNSKSRISKHSKVTIGLVVENKKELTIIAAVHKYGEGEDG